MSKQDEQLRKQKRDKILRSASQLFADHGYVATTISEVAKASGVSFGSVFTYFPSKENLFNCVILEQLAEMRQSFFDIEDLGKPSRTIQKMIQKHMKFISEQSTFLRIAQHVIAQKELFPELFQELDDFHSRLKVVLRPMIQEGQRVGELEEIEPDFVATSYLSFLVGLRLAHPDEPDSDMWTTACAMAYRLFAPKRGD